MMRIGVSRNTCDNSMAGMKRKACLAGITKEENSDKANNVGMERKALLAGMAR